MVRGSGACALLFALLTMATGCTMARSAFARGAVDAGSALAAAAATLEYAHAGKLPPAYAKASFVNYRSALYGVDRRLPSLDGAPAPETVRRLQQLYWAARGALDDPCLDDGCDWRGQVEALHRASEAFLEAGNG